LTLNTIAFTRSSFTAARNAAVTVSEPAARPTGPGLDLPIRMEPIASMSPTAGRRAPHSLRTPSQRL
jgi:hypothetical protein